MKKKFEIFNSKLILSYSKDKEENDIIFDKKHSTDSLDEIKDMINCISKEDQKSNQIKCANPAALAMEFECGDCCKKVLLFKDGKTELDLDENTGLLSANDNSQLFLKVFNNGEVVEKQVMKKIFVKKMCSVEFGVIELNPKGPINSGLSKFAFEFECGPCCKKVLNVEKFRRFRRFLFLFPPKGESLIIKAINGGKLVDVQCARFMIIDRKLVCSLEKDALEVDC